MPAKNRQPIGERLRQVRASVPESFVRQKNQHDGQHGRTLRKQLSAIPNPELGKESQLRFETAEERFSQQASFGMTDWLLFAVG